MKKSAYSIKDPETEAKELENILRDMSESVRKSNRLPGKSGLSYTEFKANFLKTIKQAAVPSYGCH